MSGRFRLEMEAARSIAKLHGDGLRELDSVAASAPASVDAGPGGEHVVALLAAASKDAGALARVSGATASAVDTAVDEYTGYDAAAAGTFSALGAGMK